ncbi:MAG: WYL domain-containing protein [Candidatus Sericytochromatia bacterium]|nr:WYL domain-containing protein [Candidatus Sericytochromatia bacterium]
MSRAIEDVLRDAARVLDHLQTHGPATAIALGEALGLDRRRVYDHVRYLRAFFGPGVVRSRGGRFGVGPDAPVVLHLGPAERQVLAVTHALLARLGMPHEASLQRILTRLVGGSAEAREEQARLRTEAAAHLHLAEPVVYRAPTDEALITRLYELCTARPRRPVRFAYRSLGSPDQPHRRVWPLGLVFNHAWYLIGYDERKQPPVRTYALDRLSDLQPEAFGGKAALDAFDLSARMREAWRLIVAEGPPQRVVLRMPAELAASRKHPTQEVLAAGPDGLHVAYAVSDPHEMLGFILGHCHQVEVIEPAALRATAIARLQAGLALYTGGPTVRQ